MTKDELKNKRVCITGSFAQSRKNMAVQLSEAGAKVINHCNSKTDFIFLSDEVLKKPSQKFENALELKEKGRKIRFISEATYYNLFS